MRTPRKMTIQEGTIEKRGNGTGERCGEAGPCRALFGKYRLRPSAPSKRKCHSDVKPETELLADPHHPRHRRAQLLRIVAHAVLEDRLYFLHNVYLLRRISIQHN